MEWTVGSNSTIPEGRYLLKLESGRTFIPKFPTFFTEKWILTWEVLTGEAAGKRISNDIILDAPSYAEKINSLLCAIFPDKKGQKIKVNAEDLVGKVVYADVRITKSKEEGEQNKIWRYYPADEKERKDFESEESEEI